MHFSHHITNIMFAQLIILFATLLLLLMLLLVQQAWSSAISNTEVNSTSSTSSSSSSLDQLNTNENSEKNFDTLSDFSMNSMKTFAHSQPVTPVSYDWHYSEPLKTAATRITTSYSSPLGQMLGYDNSNALSIDDNDHDDDLMDPLKLFYDKNSDLELNNNNNNKVFDEQLYECVLMPKKRKFHEYDDSMLDSEHQIKKQNFHQFYDIDTAEPTDMRRDIRSKVKDFGDFVFVENSNKPSYSSSISEKLLSTANNHNNHKKSKSKLKIKSNNHTDKQLEALFHGLKFSLEHLLCVQNEECYGGIIGDTDRAEQLFRHIHMSKRVFDQMLDNNNKHHHPPHPPHHNPKYMYLSPSSSSLSDLDTNEGLERDATKQEAMMHHHHHHDAPMSESFSYSESNPPKSVASAVKISPFINTPVPYKTTAKYGGRPKMLFDSTGAIESNNIHSTLANGHGGGGWANARRLIARRYISPVLKHSSSSNKNYSPNKRSKNKISKHWSQIGSSLFGGINLLSNRVESIHHANAFLPLPNFLSRPKAVPPPVPAAMTASSSPSPSSFSSPHYLVSNTGNSGAASAVPLVDNNNSRQTSSSSSSSILTKLQWPKPVLVIKEYEEYENE